MDAQEFGGKPGEAVPEVDPADVQAVWQLYEDAAKRHPGQQFAIGSDGIELVCTPGANALAVYYRNAMLHMLVEGGELSPWIRDGKLDDALFRAAAITPMQWMQVGVTQQGLPLDVEEFLRRV